MEMTKKILEKYLPPHEITYCDVEENHILGLGIKCAGVAVKFQNGLEVFGSSSGSENPLMLAAYECLERYVVQNQPKKTFFETSTFKWSISNGIAIHSSSHEAHHNAFYELFERNEILKSWFYNTPIKHLSCDLSDLGQEILNHFEFLVADFSTHEHKHVIGLFAFPKSEDLNLVYGFGSGDDLNQTILKAKKEFMTRFGFLWGESATDVGVEINTPAFHQEFYLKKENWGHIREWLFELKYPKKTHSGFQINDVKYVNITPASWTPDFTVMKAVSDDSLSLFFGFPDQQIFDFPFRCDIPHPIV